MPVASIAALLPAGALEHGLDPILLWRTAPEGSRQPNAKGKLGGFPLLVRGHLEPAELIARLDMRTGCGKGRHDTLRAPFALHCHNKLLFSKLKRVGARQQPII